jgi:hypothetical protein
VRGALSFIRKSLALASLRWQYEVWNLFRTGLQELRAVMRHANPLFRCLLIVGVLAVVVVLAALSAASRQPYTGTNSASWHTSKASRMNPASRRVGSETQALRRESDSGRRPRSERKVSSFAFGLNPEKHLFVLGVEKLRPPPDLLLTFPFLSDL